jgi:hypothetical protein
MKKTKTIEELIKRIEERMRKISKPQKDSKAIGLCLNNEQTVAVFGGAILLDEGGLPDMDEETAIIHFGSCQKCYRILQLAFELFLAASKTL